MGTRHPVSLTQLGAERSHVHLDLLPLHRLFFPGAAVVAGNSFCPSCVMTFELQKSLAVKTSQAS